MVLLIMGVVGCNHEAPTIVFIFPDGFNGLTLISKDENSGQNFPIVNGEYIIKVPQNGKMTVKSFKPITQWHKVVARYKSGENIPYETATNSSEIELCALPFDPDKGCYYLVGTPTDSDALSKIYDFEKRPLATKIDSPAFRK
jgi:hypothetical protein